MHVAILRFARTAPPRPSEESSALILEPSEVFLGTIDPGRRITTPVTIRNRGDVRLVIDRIDTSCDCVRMTPSTVTLDAGQSAFLSVEYNPNSEPEFRGALAVSLTGLSADHVTIFNLVVHVRIEDLQADRR